MVELHLDGDDDILVFYLYHSGTVGRQTWAAVGADSSESPAIAPFGLVTALPCIVGFPHNHASLALFLTSITYGDETRFLWTEVKFDGCESLRAETFYLRHSESNVASHDESAVGQCHLYVNRFAYSHIAHLYATWCRDGNLRGRDSHL